MTDDSVPSASGRRNSIVNAYRGLAFLICNTVVAFVLLNLLLAVVFLIRDASLPAVGPEAKYGEAALASVYPGLSAEQRQALNRETWTRPWIRDDQVMYRERPFKGKYVNVHETGFRTSQEQGPWPPDTNNLNVYVFGGSTTFGYGLPDDQTVPSFLQELLSGASGRPVRVYNFGAGYYYSALERRKFEQLLMQQHPPGLAVFIDGINDCEWGLDDKPINEIFQTGFEVAAQRSVADKWLQKLPIMRAASFVASQRKKHRAGPRVYDAVLKDPNISDRLEKSVARYLRNKRLIESVAREFGVVPVFVWQPSPGHNYDLRYHLFPDGDRFRMQDQFYRLMRNQVSTQAGPNFFWCGDLQEKATSCLYVDSVHYTAAFSRQFAQAIADQMEKYPPTRHVLRP